MNAVTTKTDNGRRCSLIILSVTIAFILMVVIVGVCVKFLTEGNLQRVILTVLICVLAVVGMTSLTVLEIRRRRAKKKEKAAATTARTNQTRVNYQLAATAPPMTDKSGWNYQNYSNRTTVQAS